MPPGPGEHFDHQVAVDVVVRLALGAPLPGDERTGESSPDPAGEDRVDPGGQLDGPAFVADEECEAVGSERGPGVADDEGILCVRVPDLDPVAAP
ncbi:hypothetical protein ACFYPA_05895 [Streptomyces sp. NPDC005775]|uniref:hypothetical protein n=1 Tax=Streptomyces sp. NPDC005775 TaxID=3364729 RepID=UPI003698AA74